MKNKHFLTKTISVITLCCILLSASSIAAFSASVVSVISQSNGALIDPELGVLLCYTDFETKTVEITGYEASLVTSVEIDVEDEKWINSNPYGGYIHMAGYSDKPTRTVISFNGDDGVKLEKGTLIATYKAAAKEPTDKTFFGLSDKIT